MEEDSTIRAQKSIIADLEELKRHPRQAADEVIKELIVFFQKHKHAQKDVCVCVSPVEQGKRSPVPE